MSSPPQNRLRIEIQGAVQGVGFRPFVFRLATDTHLTGEVINDSRGVRIDVEGERSVLEDFAERVVEEAPPLADVQSVSLSWLEPIGFDRFAIRRSDAGGIKSVAMLPDAATCPDCRREILDPEDRRHAYPFTNCTNCGPRFSIIRSLPYDRPNTTMRGFEMCAACRDEYEDPTDRRFHAQPNACPVCGPQVELWDRSGKRMAAGIAAIEQTVREIRDGRVLAVKGLGGFHLIVDARNGSAVEKLRTRKGRYAKPLAVMVRDLAMARRLTEVPKAAAKLLSGVEAPIVLLDKKADTEVDQGVSPGNPRLGVMLPYTPLHHLLMRHLDFPVVATSGNLSDEPICTDNQEALRRLATIADRFLVHDRPIERHVDDGVSHLIAGDPQLIRRARGRAPMPLRLPRPAPSVLAVGGHLKNVVSLSVGDRVFLSQHIGDMETPQAFEAFEAVMADFIDMYDAVPQLVAHDLHPDYPSTRWALDAIATADDSWRRVLTGLPVVGVQHHHAHLASCLAEHGVERPALGVTWDGTGFGPDGTIWGGEFLVGSARGYRRVAHLRRFALPGGDAAVKEPRRVALALLWEIWGDAALDRRDLPPVEAFSAPDRTLLAKLLTTGFRSPRTSSAGRLFDGVAAILGLHQRVAFEGQAAMALESIADPSEQGSYPIPLRATSEAPDLLVVDWQPLVESVVAESQRGIEPGIIAGRFHNSLVDAIVEVARAVGEERVALTGGCFQNRRLTEQAADRLQQSGLDVLIHRQVPANDGGISLGQVAVAAAQQEETSDDGEVGR